MRLRYTWKLAPAVLALGIVHAAVSHAADWVLVIRDSSGEFYRDAQPMQADAPHLRLVRELHIPKGDKEINRFAVRAEYDCAARKKRVFQNFQYLTSGETALSSTNQPPWEEIGRAAASQALFEAACGKK